MKEIQFISPSDRELDDAMEFYNEQLPGLGEQFFDELMHSLDLICTFPNSWKKVGENTRKLLLPRFPYLILYIPEEEKILITAIAHQHRSPEYYIDRVK